MKSADEMRPRELLELALRSALADCAEASVRWNYETGLLLAAMLRASGDACAGEFDQDVKNRLDRLIDGQGLIAGYRVEEYNIDHINPGNVTLEFWRRTGSPRYGRTLDLLAEQLSSHPRTSSGSFWHKKIYPQQVWLDGLYMFGPFCARMGAMSGFPVDADDLGAQVLRVRDTMRDEVTGLYFHAKDESKAQAWADPATGLSPHIWGRAVGWLSMALVDILESFPEGHELRAPMLDMFIDLARAVCASQSEEGLFWQIMDAPGRSGNYFEASCSSMFAYALGKGVRLGYLSPEEFSPPFWKAIRGVVARFARVDDSGWFHLDGICKVAGLGGSPYRDGSYAYYLREPVVSDDFKGTGPFILALLEACR